MSLFHESVFSIALAFATLALVVPGCGQADSEPDAASGADPSSSGAPTDPSTTAPAVPDSTDAVPSPFREDADGRQYLGKVPLDVFFDDPLEVASDETPIASADTPDDGLSQQPELHQPGVPDSPSTSAGTENAGQTMSDWAAVLPAEALDGEIKSARNFLKQKLQSVGLYNASVTMIPSHAATIAVLAAIAEKHSDRISWKADAGYGRDLAAEMIESPLQRGPQDQRRLLGLFENLSDTLNRSRPAGLEEPGEKTFADVAEMRLVMMRIEAAEKTLRSEISESAFQSESDLVRHEAVMLAGLMKAMTTDGYGFSDDPEFIEYAENVIAGAQGMRDSVDANDFAAFELNLSRISTSCQDCHRDYKNN